MARAARLVGRGFVVTVDYGDEAAALYGDPRRFEGTLRAFRGHEFAADVLADPGAQDLTTTVNWTHVRAAGEAAGLKTVVLERLNAFLLRAGCWNSWSARARTRPAPPKSRRSASTRAR